MMQKNDLFSKEWCDLVFDEKQRDYGAYELRTQSGKLHFRAFVIAACIFLLLAGSPFLVRKILPHRAAKDKTVRVLSDIKLEMPKEDEIIREVPPPPEPLRNTIDFSRPEIKPDELAEEEPKTQKELLEEKALISNTTFDKGTDDPSIPAATTENAKIAETPEVPLVRVDQMPQFPGGEMEMLKFIKSNLRYPRPAQANNIQGTVILNFVVDKEGKITNIRVVKGIGFGCDEESMRVLGIMPAWNPGKQRGQTVMVSFTMPIRFILR